MSVKEAINLRFSKQGESENGRNTDNESKGSRSHRSYKQYRAK